MDKIKIALCLEYPILQHGGVEVLVRELIHGLHDQFDVYLVSDDEDQTIQSSLFSKMLKGWTHFDPSKPRKNEIKSLINWGNSHKINLFHFHHGTYGWGARSWNNCVITRVSSAGFRCISTNHGAFSFMDFVGAQRPLWFKLAALCICWPAKLRQLTSVEWEVTVSKHDLNAMRRWYFPLKHKFRQIYHSMLDGKSVRNQSKQKFILCLGTIGARKGQHYLADAFGMVAKNHPDWRLVIAGRHSDPVTTQKMFDFIAQHKIEGQVEILTNVSDSHAKSLLTTAAIFAMPSIAEGLGLSLQEAMFYGAACIGTNAGGITDMLEDENTGLMVPMADSMALANGIERLISDSSLRTRLSENGSASIIAKGMTRQLMCQRHSLMYQS